MAARPSARTAPNTPLLYRHGDGFANSGNQHLPTGRCNFTNLSIGGATPPRCGCQRFWDRAELTRGLSGAGQAAVNSDEVGWCYCSHHACFHESEFVRDMMDPQTMMSSSLRSVSQRSLRQENVPNVPQLLQAPTPEDSSRRGEIGKTQVEQLTESALPDTSSWGRIIPSEYGGQLLPPIPSQCLLPSDISSGGMSASQSFASLPGQDLHSYFPSITHGPNIVSNSTHIDLTVSNQDVPFDQFMKGSDQIETSQTATALIRGGSRDSPDHGANDKFYQTMNNLKAAVDAMDGTPVFPKNSGDPSLSIAPTVVTGPASEPNSPKRLCQPYRQDASVSQIIPGKQSGLDSAFAHRNLKEQVQNHEIRLDSLENIHSYSFVEETHDQIQAMKGDFDELRSSVEQIEARQAMNDMNSFASSRRIDDGNGSVISTTSSAMIASALQSAEFSHRLGALETQFSDLRSVALPSYSRPWKIEVVILPFGPELQGIWSTLGTFHSQPLRNNSVAVEEDRQTLFGSVPGDEVLLNKTSNQQHWEDVHRPFGEWLVARACRQGSKVEERLRSRGLVKEIQVKGPDARDVQAAMQSAFGHLTRTLSLGSAEPPDSLHQFHALKTAWIPLRKLHKDSRLRLLEPSEMVTSAIWTVMFLSSSVAMRSAGEKRLYVTTKQSYLQSGNDSSEWTWQKLRVLPRVFPDLNHSISEVGEADAREECWEYDSRLDPPPSLHSSFDSQHPSLSIRQAIIKGSNTSRSSNQSSADASHRFGSPVSAGPGRVLSPLMERHVRPFHSRTTSMPAMIPLKISPTQGKRRIASFDHELHPSDDSPQLSPIRQSASLSLKRRRISRSPSRPRDTPRWSVGPPSPYYYEEQMETKRGTTPFAYATPHSNNPYGDFRPDSMAGMTADYDDDLGSTTDDAGMDEALDDYDSDGDQDHQPEDDVWEGVEDQTGDEVGEDDSDQERKALSADEVDDASNVSSQPSEYPTKQPVALYAGNKGAFQIHVDEVESQKLYGGRQVI